jgi:tetratricopeptide (TPR) repeat protein
MSKESTPAGLTGLNGLLIGAAAGLLVGLLGGYAYGVHNGMAEAQKLLGSAPLPAFDATPSMPAGLAQQLPPQGMPGATPQGAPSPEVFQRIEMNQKLVAKDPKLVGVWIQLGNDYFDSRQQLKAIDAYGKALALNPNNPDVLTDQGVMYRDLGRFDEAVANFEKAGKADPNHIQSAYNLGVVWANDKHDAAKATAAFNKVIALAPTSPQAGEARRALADLGKGPKK